jgi:sulfatase modifying factor 1
MRRFAGTALAFMAFILPANTGRCAPMTSVENYNPRCPLLIILERGNSEQAENVVNCIDLQLMTVEAGLKVQQQATASAAGSKAVLKWQLERSGPADGLVPDGSRLVVKLTREPVGEIQQSWFCLDPDSMRFHECVPLLPLFNVIERLNTLPSNPKPLLSYGTSGAVATDNGGLHPTKFETADSLRSMRRLHYVLRLDCRTHQKIIELPNTDSLSRHRIIEHLDGQANQSRCCRSGPNVVVLVDCLSCPVTEYFDQWFKNNQKPTIVLPAGQFTNKPMGRIDDLASADKRPGIPQLSRLSSPGRQSLDVIENTLGMKLVAIPKGEFKMGSDIGDYDEMPQHPVKITKPFRMGQTEVTLGQFLAFYNDGYEGKLDCERDGKGGYGYGATTGTLEQHPRYRPWNWGHPDMEIDTKVGEGKAFRHPVVNVSWNDAVAFCQWLSRKEGRNYRLPTEAEWEYACRAGTATRYWSGDTSDAFAETANTTNDTVKPQGFTWTATRGNGGYKFTAPVGSSNVLNPFGLADMQGSVGEWCSDWYDKDYYDELPAIDPKGPAAGSFRVIRGGSWRNHPVGWRSARRGLDMPSFRTVSVGFRVVLSME